MNPNKGQFDEARLKRINELINWPDDKEFDGPADYEDAENLSIARGAMGLYKGKKSGGANGAQ